MSSASLRPAQLNSPEKNIYIYITNSVQCANTNVWQSNWRATLTVYSAILTRWFPVYVAPQNTSIGRMANVVLTTTKQKLNRIQPPPCECFRVCNTMAQKLREFFKCRWITCHFSTTVYKYCKFNSILLLFVYLCSDKKGPNDWIWL